MTSDVTKEDLALVTEETFMEFLRSYDLTSITNDPEITERIKSENPQIYRILKLGMQAAPSKEARTYYECGIQIVYELLKKQIEANKLQ